MALVKCHECGKDVSTEATACPACGAGVRKPKKPRGLVGVLIAIMVGAGIFGAALQGQQKKAEEASKSPEQRAADDKARKLANQRDLLATEALKAIRDNLRNPDSVRWGDVLANADGSVICIDYRAQNGFGGMTQETIAFIKAQAKHDAGSWNKHCAGKQLNDVKDTALRLLARL